MSDLEKYTKAMIAGNLGVCVRIEQAHGLYGYPPALVGVGLAAADTGRDALLAIDEYIAGEEPKT